MSEKTATFEDKVNEVVSTFETSKEGKISIPDSVKDSATPDVLFAATAVKRQLDTQSAYTKANQAAIKFKAINSKMAEHMENTATAHITVAQQEELDELKLRDPDQWRDKLNEYDVEAKAILTSKIKEFGVAGDEASVVGEREAMAANYAKIHGFELTDDIVDSQLPATYSKQLEDGTIDFTTFMDKSYDFLSKAKVIANTTPHKGGANLGDVKGSTAPSEEAQRSDSLKTYENELY